MRVISREKSHQFTPHITLTKSLLSQHQEEANTARERRSFLFHGERGQARDSSTWHRQHRDELEAPTAILCLLQRGTHACRGGGGGTLGKMEMKNAIVPTPLECPPSLCLN